MDAIIEHLTAHHLTLVLDLDDTLLEGSFVQGADSPVRHEMRELVRAAQRRGIDVQIVTMNSHSPKDISAYLAARGVDIPADKIVNAGREGLKVSELRLLGDIMLIDDSKSVTDNWKARTQHLPNMVTVHYQGDLVGDCMAAMSAAKPVGFSLGSPGAVASTGRTQAPKPKKKSRPRRPPDEGGGAGQVLLHSLRF